MLIKYMGVLMDINEYTAADFRNFVLIYCALPYIEYYIKNGNPRKYDPAVISTFTVLKNMDALTFRRNLGIK